MTIDEEIRQLDKLGYHNGARMLRSYKKQHQEVKPIMAEKTLVEKVDEALAKVSAVAQVVDKLATSMGTVQKQLNKDDMDLNGDGTVTTSERFWYRILKATQSNSLWTIVAVISFVVITYFFG
jgi:hypothetical protein